MTNLHGLMKAVNLMVRHLCSSKSINKSSESALSCHREEILTESRLLLALLSLVPCSFVLYSFAFCSFSSLHNFRLIFTDYCILFCISLKLLKLDFLSRILICYGLLSSYDGGRWSVSNENQSGIVFSHFITLIN